MMCPDQLLTNKNIGWNVNIYIIEAVTSLVGGFTKGENLEEKSKRRQTKK